MSERVPAVILYARRVPGRRGALIETVGRMVGAVPTLESPVPRGPGRFLRFLDRNAYTSLSYVIDWLDAFRRAPMLAPTCLNIVDLLEWPRARRLARSAPLVIVLKSITLKRALAFK